MARNKRHRPMAEINVVPYIDVMLVLLVIFMVITPTFFQGVEVQLPTANAQAIKTKEGEPIILSIDASNHYYLNIATQPTKTLVASEVTQVVSRELKHAEMAKIKRQCFIKADQRIGYAQVIKGMVLLQQSGASSIGLLTDGFGGH